MELETNQTKTEATDLTDIEAFYKETFGLPLPDKIIGMTQDGVAEAFKSFFSGQGIVPEGHYISGFITDIKFEGEGKTLPVALYFQPHEIISQGTDTVN